ncbi:MAG: ankyrin repeat domain-containing protein [Akkermansia sp.]|nr:ankyrin repeat domain-containing protein [Akkermansia sp.]
MKTTLLTLAALASACLGANEIDIPTKGNFFAGDFSFSFTIGKDTLNAQNKEDLLAVYYGSFHNGILFSNGFVLQYNPATNTTTLTAGRGSMNNMGSPNQPAISEQAIYKFQPGNHVKFNTNLLPGSTYTISSKGENGKQTITLSGNGTRPETHSYNGNMNGGGPNKKITSVFNTKYEPNTRNIATTKQYTRTDNGMYAGIRFCLNEAQKHTRIRGMAKPLKPGEQWELQCLAIRMGNTQRAAGSMSAVLIDTRTGKVLAASDLVQTMPNTVAKLRFSKALIKPGSAYILYFTTKEQNELRKFIGKVLPESQISDCRLAVRQADEGNRCNQEKAQSWGVVNKKGRIHGNPIWAPIAALQLAPPAPESSTAQPATLKPQYKTVPLRDARYVWYTCALVLFGGTIAILATGVVQYIRRRKALVAANDNPAQQKKLLLKWGGAAGGLLVCSVACYCFYFNSPVMQLQRAGYSDEYAPIGLFHAAQSGDADLLHKLISAGAVVHITDTTGRTALHHAILHGHSECVELLLKHHDWKNCGFKPLHLASLSNDKAAVQQLLSNQTDVNEGDFFGLSPLHIAASLGHTECLHLLLGENSADPNAADAHGNTPLHLAALNNRVDAISLLLHDNRTQANPSNGAGHTPLYLATEKGMPEAVRTMLQNEKCDTPGSLLHLAVNEAHPATLAELIKSNRFDVNTIHDYKTALYLAVEQGRTQCVKALLAAPNINVNAAGRGAMHPLQIACINGMEDCFDLLLQADGVNVSHPSGWSNNTPLHTAVTAKNLTYLKKLLKHRSADVNRGDKRNRTPLHTAAEHDVPQAAKLLLASRGINPEIEENDKKYTPLALAFSYNSIHTAEVMIRAGCQKPAIEENNLIFEIMLQGEKELPRIKKCLELGLADVCKTTKPFSWENREYNPLMYAIVNNHPEAAELMVQHAGNSIASVRDEDGNSPLLAATLAGHTKLVKIILEKKIFDINATNNLGATALRCAVTANKPEIVKMLLAQPGIDVNKANNSGNTALHKAAAKGYTKCLDLLLAAKGINIHARNRNGETPMFWALRELHRDCILNLQKAGAKPEGSAHELAIAALRGNHNKVRDLISRGIDHHARYMVRSLLQRAASDGNADMLAALLTSIHADLNGLYNGMPLLYRAARNGHPRCVRVLLSKHGIDPNITCQPWPRRTPLAIAINRGHAECAQLLIKHPKTNAAAGRAWSAFASAIDTRNPAMLKMMLDQLKDANLHQDLSLSCIYDNQPESLRLLLQHPVLKQDATHELIKAAISYNAADCLPILLADKRIDTSFLPENIEAILRQDPNKLRQMALEGTDFCTKDDTFLTTPLHLAARLNLLESMRTLITIPGIDVNSVDPRNNDTLLHTAAAAGYTDMVKLLVQFPTTNLNALNAKGVTPLFKATKTYDYESVETKKRKAACAEILRAARQKRNGTP